MAHYITDERAFAIRGELCEKHGAQWLHHYHHAIEEEVIRNLPAPERIGWPEAVIPPLVLFVLWATAWVFS